MDGQGKANHRNRGVIHKMILALASLVVFALLVEGVLRFAWWRKHGSRYGTHWAQTHNQMRYTPYGISRLPPNSTVSWGSMKWVDMETDWRGCFHNGDRNRPIFPEDKVVMMIGGSTMLGLGVPSQRETIPALLEHRLGTPWKVANCGRAGVISFQELLLLFDDELWTRLHPDIVIVMDGANDYATLATCENWKPNWHPWFDRVGETFDQAYLYGHNFNPLDILRKRTATGRMLADLIADRKKGDPRSQKTAIPPDQFRESVLAYIRNHVLAQRLCAMRGVPYLVFLQPVISERWRPLTETEKRVLADGQIQNTGDWYVQIQDRWFESVGVSLRGWTNFVDITDSFVTPAEGWWADSIHYTAQGNDKIAQRIAERIR